MTTLLRGLYIEIAVCFAHVLTSLDDITRPSVVACALVGLGLLICAGVLQVRNRAQCAGAVI